MVLGCSAASRAEESSEKENGEFAEALESVKVSLGDGLRVSEAQGTPISGKFEMEDGKVQLSVHTMKDGKFVEVTRRSIPREPVGYLVREPTSGGITSDLDPHDKRSGIAAILRSLSKCLRPI